MADGGVMTKTSRQGAGAELSEGLGEGQGVTALSGSRRLV